MASKLSLFLAGLKRRKFARVVGVYAASARISPLTSPVQVTRRHNEVTPNPALRHSSESAR